MILTDDIRIGVLIGLCLVGDSPAGTAEALFHALHNQAWQHIDMTQVMDGELRDAIAKDCGLPSETPEQ